MGDKIINIDLENHGGWISLLISDGSFFECAHVKTVDSRPRKFYGAPVDVWIRYTVRSSTKTPGTAARLHSYIVVRVLKCMSALCTNLSKCIIEVMLW